MTPKEKALELGNKFYRGSVFDKTKEEHLQELVEAKKYAIVAVEEILNNYYKNHFQTGKKIDYWIEVKNEIERL
jgi:hypothetical protein